MQFSSSIRQFLDKKRIVEFTKIQQAVFKLWPFQNIIGIAETGSGKTFAYLLPLLDKINTSLDQPQAVIFVPTKELQWQIINILTEIKKYFKTFTFATSFSSKAQLIVSLLNEKYFFTSKVRYVVFDEIDMFLEQSSIQQWLECVHLFQKAKPLFAFFSATLFNQQLQIIKKQVINTKVINLHPKQWIHPLVKHFVVHLNTENRFSGLLALLKHHQNQQIIVFCSNQKSLKQLTQLLSNNNISFGSIYGSLIYQERKNNFTKATNNKLKLLVVSDLFSRGIDLNYFSVVISWDLPKIDSFYIHRSGRVARLNSWGRSYLFWNDQNQSKLNKLIAKGIKFQNVSLTSNGDLKFLTENNQKTTKKPLSTLQIKKIKAIKAKYKKIKPNYKKYQKQQIQNLLINKKKPRSWKNF